MLSSMPPVLPMRNTPFERCDFKRNDDDVIRRTGLMPPTVAGPMSVTPLA